MTIDPPLPTMGLVLFASLIGMLVVGFAFAAAAKRGAAAIVALVLCIALGGALLTGVTYQRNVNAEAVAHARAKAEAEAAHLRELARQIATKEKQAALLQGPSPTQLLGDSQAEVASDEELAAVASAPPKIELDSEIVIGDKAEDVKSDRPVWIDFHPSKDNQRLITSGPFTTQESCEADTQKQIIEWLRSRHLDLWPNGDGGSPGVGVDVSQFIKSQYEELRETSVGKMHLLYTLAEITPEFEAQIAKSFAEAAAQMAKRRGVRTVTFAGAGVLSLVALTHIVLKSGGRKAKKSAP
jgi:hypothetical protein